jgi:methylated-DNA-protein-cysteine methyltransferase-like protein
MFIGVDVSASRGYDVAALNERKRLVLLAKARDSDALGVLARGLPRDAVVAVDSPPRPSLGLLGPDRAYRVAEAEAMARGVSLHMVPRSVEEAPAWMRAGFDAFAVLEKAGFPLFTEGDARPGVSFEVYPYLSYVVLSGSRRPRATAAIDWARRVLKGRVSGLPSAPTKDECDAAVAALSAWHFAHGLFCGLGDPREGVIIAPCSPAEFPGLRADRRLRDQLALPISSAESRPVIGPPPRTTFADRVLRTVARIPAGAVATYGDLARWCGEPTGARAVGALLAGHAFEVACHRVVSAQGACSAAYPGGAAEQRKRLESEGVTFRGARVDLEACRWRGPS